MATNIANDLYKPAKASFSFITDLLKNPTDDGSSLDAWLFGEIKSSSVAGRNAFSNRSLIKYKSAPKSGELSSSRHMKSTAAVTNRGSILTLAKD